MSSASVLASMTTALAAGMVMRLVLPPPKRLRARVDPYLSPSLSAIARPARSGAVSSVFGPIVRDLADWVGRKIERSGAGVTALRLRQAGWFPGKSETEAIGDFRMVQLRALTAGLVASLAIGHLLGASGGVRAVLMGLGVVIGGTRSKGRLERAIESRRETMKVEIYTINQLLAMRVRAGGGVMQAVMTTIERGSGEVVAELREAVRLHRSGWRGADAFRRVAELTPEPFCSRTYRLLATAEERGADLAGALLSLSEDVRETRRESIKRNATKRRAAMLVPTIAILAPVLILFVAAPLPYLITGWQ
ncbi:MAG TPA: type II secretion system F family protein [Acidimicrobiia bacterium]|nr:type II secretion system F family protein [Acidimicrobiia bacterium]